MAELVIRGERFAAEDDPGPWPLMKLAKSQQQGDNMAIMAGMYDFVLGILTKGERQRFIAFMDEAYVSQDELNDAVGTLIQEQNGRPLEQLSSSSNGSIPNGGASRAVSSWQGTEEEEAASSTAGPSHVY